MRKTSFISLALAISGLVLAISPAGAQAQNTGLTHRGRLEGLRRAADGSPTREAAAGASIKVSKTAFVNGQNVCGTITIKNTGTQPATVSGIVDFLEVHFPGSMTPPALPAGSTPNWFTVAQVPIALPGPIARGATATIPYCFSLCLAADFPGANSMRNVVTVTVVNNAGSASSFTTKSTSFAPPVLDCRACCLPDGSCTDTLPGDCAAAGGLAQAAGSDCATIECTQACCLGDGSCSDETLSDCQADGGQPLGLGTDCASANPTCRGACCALEGCLDDLSVVECDTENQSTFLGFDTNCESELAVCPSGACCFGDTCSDLVSGLVHTNQHGCEYNYQGTYQGDGTTCASADPPCSGGGGACCAFFGCVDGVSIPECEDENQNGGTYMGLGTDCESVSAVCPTGSCCFGDTCNDGETLGFHLNHSYCENSYLGTYRGDGTTCASAETPCDGGGACCSFFGCVDGVSIPECEDENQNGGTYMGLGTDCESVSAVCPTGSCCFGDTCNDGETLGFHLNHSYCENSYLGTYRGDGTTCASAETPCDGGGACCSFFGCMDGVSIPVCEDENEGTYMGIGTDCESVSAVCPTGACCLGSICGDDETLGINLNQYYCENSYLGVYQGDGTTCAASDCTTACCFGSTCEELMPADCEAQGGDPQGPGTDCGFGPITPCSTILPP